MSSLVQSTTIYNYGPNTLQIQTPVIDGSIIYVDADYNFHFHVFNLSNGVPINNKTIICAFHLMNTTGFHIFSNNNIQSFTSDYDFSVLIKGTNFSIPGYYSYIFLCNDTTTGGFSSEMFFVNQKNPPSTTQSTNNPSIIASLIIIIIVFFILGISSKELKLQVMYYGIVFVQILMLLFLNYAVEKGSSITSILYINFIVMLCILGLIGLFSIFMLSVQTMDPSGATEDEEQTKDKPKWS